MYCERCYPERHYVDSTKRKSDDRIINVEVEVRLMKRILHIADSMGMGGIQAFIMNVYRNIDRTKVQFDFMLNNCPANNYDEEIKQLGGRIFYLPARNKGLYENWKALDDFFDSHNEYDVVHMHESSLTYIEPLIAAKKHGVTTRIIHAHSTKASGSKIHTFIHHANKMRIDKIATDFFACGELAKQWMYGNNNVINRAIVVNNGIKIKDYEFNDQNRQMVRRLLEIEDSFVVGHVGRFSEVKNHDFLIDVFKHIYDENNKSKLVLVGDGELKSHIEAKVAELRLNEKVLFLGNRKDVKDLLQAFDLVIIPSLYEGFPVCAIEAQASGVACIMSNSITKDAALKSNTVQLSLSDGPDKWADSITGISRVPNNECLYSAGYDIDNTIKQLLEVYGLEKFSI